MTTQDYSFSGLQDLLNDLESLTLSIVNLPQSNVSQRVFDQLHQDQLDLVERAQSYMVRAKAHEHHASQSFVQLQSLRA